MKVVLIHPDHENSTDSRLDPPLGLLYIAAYLRKNNIDVEVCDLSGQPNLIIPYADIYGITSYISTLEITKKITDSCRKTNPNCKIVIGGAHATACPEDFPYADHVVVGFGEKAMYDIVSGSNINRIQIGYQNINPILYPAYDLIDPFSYHRKIGGKTSLPVLTSRGCPYKCSFCGLERMHKLTGSIVNLLFPEDVYYIVSKIKNDFGIDKINFQDDIFTLNRKRLFKILDLIKSLNIGFRCMGRANYDTEETYEKLAEAGCSDISWGIESGSQLILDRMNKQVKVQDNYNVIKWAKKYGITSRAFFIFGFPGETKDTIEETKRFIENSDPDQIFVSSMVPYPATDVGDNPEKYGISNMSKDYNQYYQVSKDGTGGITIDTEWLSKEEFRELELNFREWTKQRPMRGFLQDYEK